MSFSKLNLKVNPLPLQYALKQNAYLFGQYKHRAAEGGPHMEMEDIWVRFNDIKPYEESGDFSGFVEEHDSVWYPAYYMLPEVKDIIFKIMRAVNGERLGGILITKLPPGGKIHPHTDAGWHAEYYDKFYIPVENYPGATFEFETGVIDPELGEVYQFDNSQLHWVNNETNHDRIAMVVCIRHEGQPRYKETQQ